MAARISSLNAWWCLLYIYFYTARDENVSSVSADHCGMMITGEHKFKRQKNANVHEYTYYRCTKKTKIFFVPSAVREKLDRLDLIIRKSKKFLLPKRLGGKRLQSSCCKDHVKSAQSLAVCVKKKQDAISTLNIRLERLLNGYLEQDIEQEIYRIEKSKLLLRKKSLDEEMSSHCANKMLGSNLSKIGLKSFGDWTNLLIQTFLLKGLCQKKSLARTSSRRKISARERIKILNSLKFGGNP